MSKQTSRQTSKQGQSANKRSSNQNSKQASPANKQIASGSVKQSTSATKPPTRQAMKQERREEERQRQLNAKRRAARNKRILIGSLVAAVVLVAAVTIFAYAKAHNPADQSQATQTEQDFNPAYAHIDNIYCDQLEQTKYHIHAHVTIWINGQQVQIPQSVGIAPDQSCLYWLHTHDSSGVIHIEAPNKVSPTLGNFLDIWEQKFPQLGYHDELALPAGWTVYVNGKQVNTTFNQLVLQPHMVITIAYNSPNITPDTSYNWQAGQ